MKGKYGVLALHKGVDVNSGQNINLSVYTSEELALNTARQWAVQGYDVYVYTLAAKVGLKTVPVTVDRSMAVSLETK